MLFNKIFAHKLWLCQKCDEGEKGYIVTRGAHVMKAYLSNNSTAVSLASVSEDGWYLNLGDIGFYFYNPINGKKDFYW